MSEEHPVGVTSEGDVVTMRLIDKKPSEAEIAADLKARMMEAFKPVLALMDEANQHGLLFRWDACGPAAPLFKNQMIGLRIEKHY